MAIKTNDIQEFRNLGLENEFDFYDFGDLIESGTNFNYTGTVDPPGRCGKQRIPRNTPDYVP